MHVAHCFTCATTVRLCKAGGTPLADTLQRNARGHMISASGCCSAVAECRMLRPCRVSGSFAAAGVNWQLSRRAVTGRLGVGRREGCDNIHHNALHESDVVLDLWVSLGLRIAQGSILHCQHVVPNLLPARSPPALGRWCKQTPVDMLHGEPHARACIRCDGVAGAGHNLAR